MTAQPGGEEMGLTALVPTGRGCTASKSYAAAPQSPTGFRKTSDYRLGMWFSALEFRFDGLQGLGEYVAGVGDIDAIIVRGALNERGRADPDRVNRRIYPGEDGEPPSLRPCRRRWVMVDLDGVPLPAGLSVLRPDDHAAIIDAAVREHLHENFHGARCFYHFSNSAGLTACDDLRVHLFYELDAPAEDEAIRRVFMALMPGIDESPINPVQPHYIANPKVEGGEDPLAGRRTGWRDGAAAAALPSLPEPPPKPARKPPVQTAGDDDDAGRGDTAVGVIGDGRPAPGGYLADLQRTLGHGPGRRKWFHPLRKAIFAYAGHVAAGRAPRADDRFLAFLQRALAAAPLGRGSTRTEVMADYGPAFLRRSLEGAHRRHAQINKGAAR